MKNYYYFLCFVFCSFFSAASINKIEAQNKFNQYYWNKYRNNDISPMKIIKALDDSKLVFVDNGAGKNIKSVKALILQITDVELTQYKVYGQNFCSRKHEEMFTLYNLYYNKVTREFFDENCMELICLMLLDGTLKEEQ